MRGVNFISQGTVPVERSQIDLYRPSCRLHWSQAFFSEANFDKEYVPHICMCVCVSVGPSVYQALYVCRKRSLGR